MIKKIERPKTDEFIHWISKHFDDWFDTHIQPINVALDEAVEVTGENYADDIGWLMGIDRDDSDTHKALLINIEPIKKETAADVLKEILREAQSPAVDDKPFRPGMLDLLSRAQAALEREGG